jgi:hypothetical protein
MFIPPLPHPFTNTVFRNAVIELELLLDKERDLRVMFEKRSNNAPNKKGTISNQQYQTQQKQMRALQKRLEQLVMVSDNHLFCQYCFD